VKRFLGTISVALTLLLPTVLAAQESSSAPGVSNTSNQVPYKMVKLDDPRLQKIWLDNAEDDSWWHGYDKGKYAKIAEFKNDLGQEVTMSIWIDRSQCADMNCPVRIIVAGERIFNDQVCRFEEDHTLTATRNSVFLCDYVIPLRTSKGEEN
jgi:hypothetical protein